MQALSNAVFDRALALDQSAVVLQIGPALDVRGGISSVEKLIVATLSKHINILHIASSEDGSSWRKMSAFLRSIRELASALRQYQQAVVHIHFSARGSTLRKILLARMTLRSGKPLVLHAHSGSFDTFFAGLPRFIRNVVRRTFERADCFVVLSRQWRDFYAGEVGVPLERIRVLPNPVSLPQRLPNRENREKVQFLFLGRISETKGAFVLLRAFEALSPEIRDRARLVLAGDGEVEKFRSLASHLGNAVEVHSWVDAAQRDALLMASDVFVLPSYFEGLPMSLLEAMAAGLPVITTPVGGIPDVVTNAVEGSLIPPRDIQALVTAMRTLIEDEAQRIEQGQRARARAEAFDVKQYAAALADIYRTLLL